MSIVSAVKKIRIRTVVQIFFFILVLLTRSSDSVESCVREIRPAYSGAGIGITAGLRGAMGLTHMRASMMPAAGPAGILSPISEATRALTTSTADGRIVKGRTTFKDLLEWGLKKADIEEAIGSPWAGPGKSVRDHVMDRGTSFGRVKNSCSRA